MSKLTAACEPRLRRLWVPLSALAAALALAGCGASLPVTPIVQIAPETVNLQAGSSGSQQFTATVVNASNTNVVWKVDGVVGGNASLGTVSPTGLYRPPATVPSQPVEVEAVSVANAKSSGVATITLTPGVSLQITPATATVAEGGSQQFSATVNNAVDTNVTWSVNGVAGGNAQDGLITTAGVYTAPASFQGLSQVTIGAVSVADPNQTGTATVRLQQAVAVTLTPPTAQVNVGGTQVYTAAVTGSSNQAVTWSVNNVDGGNVTVGTIDVNGKFAAPAQIPAPAQETITATSVADPTKSATAQVTIVAPLAVTIAPATVTLKPGATQQFQATVTNATDPTVVWSLSPATGAGTITTGGLYTAPSAFPGITQVTVTATSHQDPTRSGQAAITLQAPVTVAVTPKTVTVNLATTQTFAATVAGTSNTAVNWSVNGTAGGSATLGTISAAGVFTAPSTMPASASETITATSAADTSVSDSAQVTLQVPPQAFTLTPVSNTLALGKAQSGTVTLQLTLSAGFSNPVTFAVNGLPVNVTSAVTPASMTASGAVQVTLTTASISLAQSGVPVTITASSTDAHGATVTQTATVALTITGWAGHVRTLAGGPGGVGFQDGTGAADELDPTAITSHGGFLYFADKRGNALRSYALANQAVATLIGSPYNYTVGEGDGIVFDPDNNTLYVADALRNRISSFTLGDYTPKLVAGSPNDLAGDADGVGAAATFDWPHGLAISSDHTTLYVADTDNEQIRAINIATGAVTTLAGQHGVYSSSDGVGTAATFCQPTGLAIDPAGANLYVSDQCGWKVRQLALANQTVTTVAGSGQQGRTDGPALQATFNDPGAIAVDPHAGANLLYVIDGDQIRGVQLGANANVFAVAGQVGPGQADGGAATATFYNPTGLTAVADVAGAGTTTLYVADTDNGLLRQVIVQNPFTAATAGTVLTSSTLAGQPSHRGNADGVGTGAGYTGASLAAFSQPEGIVTDGKIAYVADSQNGAIRKIDLATTTVTTVAGPALGCTDGTGSAASFYQNAGLAWVPSQNVIYIADTGNGAIRKLDLASGAVTLLAGACASGYVDGTLTNARFNHPFGILASPDGTKLYIADTGNNALRLIDLTAGTVSTIAGNGDLGSADGVGAAARFAEPNGLAFDATGQNIYISDFENQAIRELNLASGTVTTIVGAAHKCGDADGAAATASLCNPAFIATDGRSLFWGDSNTGLLRVLDLATQQVSTLAGAPAVMHMVDGDFTEAAGELTGPVRYNGVFGIALAPDDSFILFTDKTANVVRIIY